MPTITLPKNTSMGDISSLGAPRQAAPMPTGGSQSGTDLQSAQTEAQIGAEQAAFGGQLEEQGQKLMEPLLKLAHAREVMQALGAADSAVLQARSQVQSLKSSGTPYTEWMPEATKRIDGVFQDAIKTIPTPAGKELALREFRNERLNLLSKVQGEVVDEDINTQRAQYVASTAKIKADYYATDDPLQRASLQARHFGTIQLLGSLGVLKPGEVEKERQAWYEFQGTNDSIDLAKKQGLTAAFKYIDENSLLTPEAKSSARNAAHSAVQYDVQAQHDAERKAEKQLQHDNEVRLNRTLDFIGDDKRTMADLNVLESQLSDMVDKRELDRSGADKVREAVRKRKDEILNPTVKDDEDLKLRVVQEILYTPQNFDATALRTESRLTPATRAILLQQHKDRLASNHFVNTFGYKQLVDQIESVAPAKPLSVWGATAPQALGDAAVLAKTRLYQFLEEASKDTQGVLTSPEVLQLGSAYAQRLVEELKTMTPPPASPRLSLEELGRQRTN